MTIKPVTDTAHIERHRRSASLSIAQLHDAQLPRHLDPFLAFDHFEMAEPFFPPHPHAGFSAVTYMFPQSKNGFVNRDSRGERIEIRPGDLHWTAAGSGLMHEEIPIVRGAVCDGLQLFVNLPASRKWMNPEVLHLSEAEVPREVRAGVEARVVFGRHGALAAPLAIPTEATLLDVTLEPGATFEHPVPAGEARFAYVLEGRVTAGDPGQPTLLRQGDAAGFAPEGDTVRVSAAGGPAHLVIAGGRPLREPVVFHGPFCMTSREDIARAIQAYEQGRMGRLERSF